MNNYTQKRVSRKVTAGSVAIGGGSSVTVQSMTNTDTRDFVATLAQVRLLEAARCDIIRLAVPDREAVKTLAKLKESGVLTPLVADIHFDYRVALECAAAGVDKIRINPGNIGGESRVKTVADACRNAGIPIRIGVNGGSVEKALLAKYGGPTPDALVESALSNARVLEKYDFYDTVISIKASSVPETVSANRILAEKCDYPLHIGVTETGTKEMGLIKSAAGIGALLLDGIGDTIRVSLTAPPENEVAAGISILKAVGLRKSGLNIVSCPTCGRTKIDIIRLAEEFERRAADAGIGGERPVTVAIMGCAVNGPGEASEADFGIAGGIGEAVLFSRGKLIRKVNESEIIDELIREITGVR